MKPFSECPVCGGATVEKEIEKLLRGGVNFAAVTVRADVCAVESDCTLSTRSSTSKQVRGKLSSEEVAGFEPLGQSFQVG